MQNTTSVENSKYSPTPQAVNKPALETKDKSIIHKTTIVIGSIIGVSDLVKGCQSFCKKEYRSGAYNITLGVVKASITTLALMKIFESVYPNNNGCYITSKDDVTKNLLDSFVERAKKTICEGLETNGKECNPTVTCSLVSADIKNNLSNFVDCEGSGFPTNRFGYFTRTPIAIGEFITGLSGEVELQELRPFE